MTNKELFEHINKITKNCNSDPELVREHSKILALIPSIKEDLEELKRDLTGKNGIITGHQILNTEYNNHVRDHGTSISTTKWAVGIAVIILIAIATSCVNLYVAYDNRVMEDKLEKIERVMQYENKTKINHTRNNRTTP